MMAPAVRKLLAISLLSALVAAPAAAFAAAAPQGPVVDVVEIVGTIDSHVAAYAIERIGAAERAHDALLVFELSSYGAVKVAETAGTPVLVERIRNATIPIATFVGPRRAVAGATAVWMAESSSVVAVGPSARMVDLFGATLVPPRAVPGGLAALAGARGRALRAPAGGRAASLGANEAVASGWADLVVPSVADMLRRIDGRAVKTASGDVTLRLPANQVTVRFTQPGPIRRLLHAFANPGLVFLCLLAGAMLMVFELFQPGFGVAGVSGILLLTAAVYGLTVLPATAEGLTVLAISIGLLTFDVLRDELLIPTAAGTAGLILGSLILFPRTPAFRLSSWLIGFAVAGALIFFVPVMTMVRRARKPVSSATGSRLVGESGDVRSVLNPEGFVWVAGELWRARSEDGARMRVGETVVVTALDGAVVIVRGASLDPPPNGSNGSTVHAG
jgi:membrane-bound serine protease (ClpP class)